MWGLTKIRNFVNTFYFYYIDISLVPTYLCADTLYFLLLLYSYFISNNITISFYQYFTVNINCLLFDT